MGSYKPGYGAIRWAVEMGWLPKLALAKALRLELKSCARKMKRLRTELAVIEKKRKA